MISSVPDMVPDDRGSSGPWADGYSRPCPGSAGESVVSRRGLCGIAREAKTSFSLIQIASGAGSAGARVFLTGGLSMLAGSGPELARQNSAGYVVDCNRSHSRNAAAGGYTSHEPPRLTARPKPRALASARGCFFRHSWQISCCNRHLISSKSDAYP